MVGGRVAAFDGAAQRDDWVAPGAYDVGPGIHRIPLPMPSDGLRAVNVYALVDGPRVVLIDAGWALEESEEALVRGLDKIGYGLADISEFLVTHAHRDHYTQAVTVRRRFGTRVSLGAGERATVELLSPPSPYQGNAHVAQLEKAGATALLARMRAAWKGPRAVDQTVWERPDGWLADGAEIALGSRTLRVIHTPGHTRGHVVFLDRTAKVLFAGDHVLPHITPSIGFEPVPAASPLADYLTSLRLLRDLPDVRLLPAHGPVAGSVHARVDELLAHHEARLDASLAAISEGAHTAYEVAGRLGWTRRGTPFAELDMFNAMLAVLETAAHLEVLAERGWLRRTVQDGVVHYTT